MRSPEQHPTPNSLSLEQRATELELAVADCSFAVSELATVVRELCRRVKLSPGSVLPSDAVIEMNEPVFQQKA